nr:phospholipid scramblase 3 [Hymenolepis microstoma]
MATDIEAQAVREPQTSAPLILPDFEVPAGLRFLLRTTNLRVYRVPIEGENKCCSAFPRKFYVADGEGNAILEGVETSSWCARLCAESCHAFELDFRDADGVTVLSMEKTAACSAFYCCNAPAISVTSGTDNYGTVTHVGSIPRTRLTISDAIDRPQLRLLGPCTRQSHYIDGIFKLKCFNERGSLGRVTVQHFAEMDSYQLFFPVDMDVRMKCLIIASAVLLDCIFA